MALGLSARSLIGIVAPSVVKHLHTVFEGKQTHQTRACTPQKSVIRSSICRCKGIAVLNGMVLVARVYKSAGSVCMSNLEYAGVWSVFLKSCEFRTVWKEEPYEDFPVHLTVQKCLCCGECAAVGGSNPAAADRRQADTADCICLGACGLPRVCRCVVADFAFALVLYSLAIIVATARSWGGHRRQQNKTACSFLCAGSIYVPEGPQCSTAWRLVCSTTPDRPVNG